MEIWCACKCVIILILKNCCPISLLKTNYKILAKILGTRLQIVLPAISHGDQTGFLKNIYILGEIFVLDSIDLCKQFSIKGIFFSIDFESFGFR